MNRFEILKYLEFDIWHSEWPLELLKGAITKDNATGNLLLQLKMCNISEKEIKSACFTIECFNDVGDLVDKDKKYAYQDINIEPYRDFGDDVAIELNDNSIRKINVILEQVVFYDDEVCKYERDEGLIIPKLISIDTLDNELLEELKKDYEEYNFEHEVKYFPSIIEQKAWNCCCGKINKLEMIKCNQCNRNKETQLKKFDESYIRELHKARLNEKKIQEEIEKINKKEKNLIESKKKKKIVILLVAIILIYIGLYSGKKYIYESSIEGKIEKQTAFKNKINVTSSSNENGNLYLLEKDGTVTFIGKNIDNSIDVSSWKDIKKIESSYGIVVGLKKDGTVVVSGDNDYGQCNAEQWTDIIDVKCSLNSVVGLKRDGTVVAVGSNENGQCNVDEWTDIKRIYKGRQNTIGLKKDGTVVAVGENSCNQCDVEGWTDIVSINSEDKCTIGLKKDGTVVAAGLLTNKDFNNSEWKNIVSIYSKYETVVGLKEDGTVVSTEYMNEDTGLNISDWNDIVSVSIGNQHFSTFIVGLKKDGTIVYTSNDKSIEEIEKLKNLDKWREIEYITTDDGNCLLGIDKDGKLHISGDDYLEKQTNYLIMED